MITKVHNIRGIGPFRNFESKQGIELEKLNLVFSENGQGKSTIADILRSLSERDESRLLGRKSVGATDQFIKFETEDGIRCLHNGSWNGSSNDIFVFDEVFINDNIYQGLSVEVDQKRRLLPIIIGEVQKRGVEKEKLLTDSRDSLNASLGKLRSRILSKILPTESESVSPLSFEEFVALSHENDIDAKIESQQRIVDQLIDDRPIAAAEKLREVKLPSIPVGNLKTLLLRELPEVAGDAKQKLEDHISGFSGSNMTSWLQRGTQYRNDELNVCPYCGQSIVVSDLIDLYQSIFHEVLVEFEEEVSSFSSRRLDFAAMLSGVKSAVESNSVRAELWSKYLPDVEILPLDYETIEKSLSAVKGCIDDMLAAKKVTLQRAQPLCPEFESVYSVWITIVQNSTEYNEKIRELNRSIDKHRAELAAGDLPVEGRKLLELRNTRIRYSPAVKSDCSQYRNVESKLDDLRSQITVQQEANSKAIEDTIDKYGVSLNKYLQAFGAGFRIVDLKQTRIGGQMRADYSLLLLQEMIPLGNEKTEISQRSFRNVLSEGDKRALAMAFFLSRIDQMNDRGNKIVVFDDPVTSMDDNRRNKTVFEIGRLAKQTKQVIVLSHRPHFLHSIWYRFCRHGDGQIRSTQLEIKSIKNSSLLETWNMEATVASLHAKRIRRVLDYYNDESDRDEDEISGELRPLLEYHYKIHYPELFERLNISTIGELTRVLDPNSPYTAVQALAATDKDLLVGLNKVHRETMHGQDPQPETLTRPELKTDCATVLKLLGRREIQLNGGY